MNRSTLVKITLAVVACEVAGGLGSLLTFPSVGTWFATLVRAPLAPPNWLFGPVWTLLYLMMGIAAGLVWSRGLKKREVRVALGIFVGQLALNVLWSGLFFGLHKLGAAFAEILTLWVAIVATILAFKKISRPAAWLLAPYLAWVTFASYLNFAIWWLN
jgi:tryptophan-rich sensory protein